MTKPEWQTWRDEAEWADTARIRVDFPGGRHKDTLYFLNSRDFKRALTCVNALAGTRNPEAVRDVLAACHEALPHIADEYAKDRMERALAKLDHPPEPSSEDPARDQIHRTVAGEAE